MPRRALLAAGASTLVALLGAEAFCRIRYGAPLPERLPLLEIRANALRGYEMVPDRDHYTYDHPVHVNRLGLRGPDLPEKLANELRILCLGDSTTFGQGVPAEETLPSLLEADLAPAAAAAGRSVRVVNGGLRGYATLHELALLAEVGPAIHPDLVVLLWYVNDLERPDVAAMNARLSSSGPVSFDTGERTEGWSLAKWRAKQVLRSSALVMKIHDLLTAATPPDITDAEIGRGLELFDRDLEAFLRLGEQRGFGFVFAAIPERGAIRGRSPFDLLRRRVSEHARAHGIQVVDLLERMREAFAGDGRLPILPYDGHYTGKANAVMARELARALAPRLAEPR